MTAKEFQWLIYLYPAHYLSRTLPVGFMRWLGRLALPVFRAARRSHIRHGEERLALATGTERTSPIVRKAVQRSLANTVTRSIDDLILNRLATSGRLTCAELKGEEHLKRAVAAGKGVVVVTGHFYANRVGKRYLAKIGYPIMSVRFDRHPELMGWLGQRFLLARYNRIMHDVITDEVLFSDPQAALKILKRLRSGGIVNVHIDALSSRDQVELPFLGRRLTFAAGTIEIIRMSGCRVLPMLCLGDSQNLSIRFEEPFELTPSDDRREFAAANLPRMIKHLESQVLAHLDQWEVWVSL